MNKKFLTLVCFLILTALAIAIYRHITRPKPESFVYPEPDVDAIDDTDPEPELGLGLQLNSEGETDMAYGYNAPRRINASQARAIMQSYPDAIILDVRTQQEFYDERIPGAILLPEYAIRDMAADVVPGKDTIILVYCRGGTRSQSAAKALVEMGYTNVYDFGGINSWPYERE